MMRILSMLSSGQKLISQILCLTDWQTSNTANLLILILKERSSEVMKILNIPL
jgi:hypothetical protein